MGTSCSWKLDADCVNTVDQYIIEAAKQIDKDFGECEPNFEKFMWRK